MKEIQINTTRVYFCGFGK